MHITSVARLRFDIMHYTNSLRNERLHNNSWLTTLPLWCELHWLQCTPSSGIRHTFKQEIHVHYDYLFFFSSYAIHADAFKPIYIYSLQNFSDILLILPPSEFLQIFHHHYHGDCRILADGMRIFNLECRYWFTTILDRRSRPSYPQHSLRMHLHHLRLDTYQPHTTPTIWRCLIWMFCYCTKCSIHPTVIISRWRLREWFWHCWFTNSFTENSSHTHF